MTNDRKETNILPERNVLYRRLQANYQAAAVTWYLIHHYHIGENLKFTFLNNGNNVSDIKPSTTPLRLLSASFDRCIIGPSLPQSLKGLEQGWIIYSADTSCCIPDQVFNHL